jgi:hypothetical protein
MKMVQILMSNVLKYCRVIEKILHDVSLDFSSSDNIAVGLYDAKVIDLMSGKGHIDDYASSVKLARLQANVLLVARSRGDGSCGGFIGTQHC